MTELSLQAVLPVSTRDLRRARMCVRSLARYFPTLDHLWVVHVDGDETEAASLAALFPRATALPESTLLGDEAKRFPLLHRVARKLSGPSPGWYRQQILKLAMSTQVGSPFYLTLDADILVTREVTRDALFVDGRARTVRHEMAHPTWYFLSAQALHAPRLRYEYGVTPAILHRDICGALLRRLNRDPVQAPDGARGPWRRRLERRLGWTEYALYFTFAEAERLVDTHHHAVGYDDWFGPCAWSDWLPGDESWSAPHVFDQSRSGGPFSLVSARARVPVDVVESLVAQYL